MTTKDRKYGPCDPCLANDHTHCIHQWASGWCTCKDDHCQRRKYNNAMRKMVDMAERIGLMVSQDLDQLDRFPPLYDDMRVAMIVPTGTPVEGFQCAHCKETITTYENHWCTGVGVPIDYKEGTES